MRHPGIGWAGSTTIVRHPVAALRKVNRPFHYRPHPLERLPRVGSNAQRSGSEPPDLPARPSPTAALSAVRNAYRRLVDGDHDGEVAAARAPVPDDLEHRVIDIKGPPNFSMRARSA